MSRLDQGMGMDNVGHIAQARIEIVFEVYIERHNLNVVAL